MADAAITIRSAQGEVRIATDLIVDPTFGLVHLLRTVGGAPAEGGGLTNAELRAVAVDVAQIAPWAVTGAFYQATQPVSLAAVPSHPVTGPLTDAELRAVAVPVSGTFWQATQPVSGPVTDAQLRAAAVPVSGPLTDAQLRATAVPISGPLTDAQLRAVAVPISLASQPTAGGKTLTFVPVNQGAAGTTVLAAASGGNKHKLMGCMLTMSADGTLKFHDADGDLTGPLDIAAKGGFVLSTSILPFCRRLLSISRSVLQRLVVQPEVSLCY